MKIKINKSIIFVSILFLAGLSLLLYPFISNQWNNYRQSQLASTYDTAVEEMVSSGQIDYEEQWSNANAYNQALLPSILPDSFAVAAATDENGSYMTCLNLTGNGMMGYVEIPKIDVKLPIFHTTEEEVLQVAAGHLEGSSLPVGGANTHSVISAHRGLPSATLFTDLDKIEKGDHFLLKILDDTLCYQVDKITTAEPEDTSALVVEDGQDLVTLLTCTPYSVNSHRLLVRGHRVEYVESAMEDVPKALFGVSPRTSYLLWVIVGLAVTGIFIILLYMRERKRKKAASFVGPGMTVPSNGIAHREYQEYADNKDYKGYREYTDNDEFKGYKAYEENTKDEEP